MPDSLVPLRMLLVPSKLLPQCWSSEGVSACRCMDSLRGTAWDSRFFFHHSICTGLCSQNLGGLIFLALEPWVEGAWCGAGIPYFPDIPPKFLSTTCGCGTSLFHVSTPPTSLGGCGFFNSIVVRLPFNLTSDGSEGWLFYSLVLILIWLCKEVSRAYLCCHLDQKGTL